MSSLTAPPYKDLQKSLPMSQMVLPDTLFERIKYAFWRVYTPFHPWVRDMSLRVGIVTKESKAARFGARQKFLLGTIAPAETIESVIAHLVGKGYYNHFVAWEDEGEIVSLRYAEDFAHQYHIRIFEDGEVRGHYEYTPECHPIMHYYERGCFEPRVEEFLKILEDKIIPA
jgi:hypothetical protein